MPRHVQFCVAGGTVIKSVGFDVFVQDADNLGVILWGGLRAGVRCLFYHRGLARRLVGILSNMTNASYTLYHSIQ